MARWFNIGGPCIAAKHYMLSATERLPEAASLIRKEQYFVDADLSKPWEGKISSEDIEQDGKSIHVICC